MGTTRISTSKESKPQEKRAARVQKPLEPVIDTVVMSGGAPTSPLMAGFLYALIDRKPKEKVQTPKVFRNFHTSGAGALMALLLLAPKNGDARKTLREWVESGIADEVYKLFPVNFKLFRKPGPFSPMLQRLAERYKVPRQQPDAPTNVLKLRGATRTEPLKERDPIRELLAEWLARPPHDDPAWGIKRRRGNGLVELYASLLNLWQGEFDVGRYRGLISHKDPIKLFRDKWLESLFTSEKQRRVYNDLVDLWFAMVTPSTLAPRSEGLAAPLPFLDSIVDFEKLKSFKGHFCVNAYNMSREALEKKSEEVLNEERKKKIAKLLEKQVLARQQLLTEQAGQTDATAIAKARKAEAEDEAAHVMKLFHEPQAKLKRKEKHKRVKVMELFEHPKGKSQRDDLGPEHIRAAFSMPFIYPPTELNLSYYSEGADHEPVHFHQKHLDGKDSKDKAYTEGERIVLLDVLATLEDYLVRRPRDLWDAYIISIMTPVVALAKMAILEFEEDQEDRQRKNTTRPAEEQERIFKLVEIDWKIPSESQPYVMDWSYSNLDQLFKLGEEAGRTFMDQHGAHLPDYRAHFKR